MKQKLFALAAAACLLLSGCSPITLPVDELMRPPQLSESQRKVHDALVSALGTSESNISLRYPRAGDNRSAFLFYDLDGDGRQEAMVFYSLAEAEEELYINVMEQSEEGEWYSVYDVAGAGSGVESVEFSSISRDDGRDIIVGWTAEENDIGQLSVLRYEEKRLQSLYQSRYTSYTTADLNGDGLQELLTVTMSGQGGKPFASLVCQREQGLVNVSNLPLNVNMTAFGSLSAGWVNQSEQGLVVDGYEGQNFTTDLLLIKNDLFSLPYPEESEFYQRVSRRQGVVYSRDIDGDGIIELPVQQAAPEKTGLYFTTYCRMEETLELQPVCTAFVNTVRGYAFYLPDEWVGNVTASESKNGEVVFKTVAEGQNGHELLRIRVYSEKDYQDKFDTQHYQKLGHRGNFQYYAAVTEGDQLSITQSRVKELFEIT